MQISNNGIALIKRFEGCRLTAYPDPAPAVIPDDWLRLDGKSRREAYQARNED